MADRPVLCPYRVRADREEVFINWLERHWSTLAALSLVTKTPPTQYRFVDEPTYVEIFAWREGGAERAHADPQVRALWSEVEPLLEARDGRPKWEFPDIVAVPRAS